MMCDDGSVAFAKPRTVSFDKEMSIFGSIRGGGLVALLSGACLTNGIPSGGVLLVTNVKCIFIVDHDVLDRGFSSADA